MSLYDTLVFIVVGVGAVLCLVFIITYWVVSGGKWLRSSGGRFMMLTRINILALYLLIMAHRLFGDWPGRKPITVIFFVGFVIGTSIWPISIMRHERIKHELRED